MLNLPKKEKSKWVAGGLAVLITLQSILPGIISIIMFFSITGGYVLNNPQKAEAINKVGNYSFENAPEPNGSWRLGTGNTAEEANDGSATETSTRTTSTWAIGAASYDGYYLGGGGNQNFNRVITQSFTPTSSVYAKMKAQYKRRSVGAVDNFQFYVRLKGGIAVNSPVVITAAAATTVANDAIWNNPGWSTSRLLTAGTTYTIEVNWQGQIDNGEGAGAYVDDIQLQVSPANIAAIPNASQTTSVDVNWSANSPPAAGPSLSTYYIGRSLMSGGPYTQVGSTSGTTFTDVVGSSNGNTQAYYVVWDEASDGATSPYSVQTSALTKPGPPGTLSFTSVSTSSLTAEWSAPAGGSPTYALERAPDVSGSPGTYNNIATTSVTNYPDSGLTEGATYWYRARGLNNSGYGEYSGQASVRTQDLTPPNVSVTDPTGSKTLTGSSKTIAGSAIDGQFSTFAFDSVAVRLKRNDGVTDSYWNGGTWQPTSTYNTATISTGQGTSTAGWNYTWNLPSDEDAINTYEINAQAVDSSNNTGTSPTVTNLKIDNKVPTINSFTINSGSYTNTTAVTLNSDVTDGSAPILMRFANITAGLSSASTQPYNTTAPYNLSAGDGQKWVYSQFRDSPTNADPPNTYNETTAGAANSYDDIILDTTPPTELLKLPASGATGIALGDNITFTFIESNEIEESSIVNTGVEGTSTFYIKRGTSWVDATVSYNPATKTAELNPTNNLSGSRTYTVYMTNNVKDKANNYFAGTNWSFTTVNDNEGPDVSITNLANNQTLTDPTDKTITGTADDSSKGNNLVDNVSIRIKRSDNSYWYGSSWQSTEAWNTATGTTAWSYDWNFDPPNQDGSPLYDITARATDDSPAQNISTTAVNSITIDNTAPVGTFTIGSGNPQYTTSQTNNLYQSVTGASTMAFSNDNNTFTTDAYSATYNNWSLSAGNGTKTVWARFIDTAANTTNVSDTIIFDDTPPYWWMRTPANGATSVAISTAVKIKINDATSGVDSSTIDENSFYLKRTSDGATISVSSVTYSGSTKYATITPQSNLEYNTQYTAYVTSDIKDNAGNNINPTQWSFTTKQEPQNPSSGTIYLKGVTGVNWDLDEQVPSGGEADWITTKNNGEISEQQFVSPNQWQNNSIEADSDWDFDIIVSNNTSTAASIQVEVGTDEPATWFTTGLATINANADKQAVNIEYTDSSARTVPSGKKLIVKVIMNHTENNQTLTVFYNNSSSKVSTSKYFSQPIPVLGTPLLILLVLLILYFLYRKNGIEGFFFKPEIG